MEVLPTPRIPISRCSDFVQMNTEAKFPTLKKNQNSKNMPSHLHVGSLTSFYIKLLLIVSICENLPPPLLRFSLRGQFILCGPSYFAPLASPEEENTWRVKKWHLPPPSVKRSTFARLTRAVLSSTQFVRIAQKYSV